MTQVLQCHNFIRIDTGTAEWCNCRITVALKGHALYLKGKSQCFIVTLYHNASNWLSQDLNDCSELPSM